VPNDKRLIHDGNDSYSKKKNISNENDNAEEESYENYDDDVCKGTINRSLK